MLRYLLTTIRKSRIRIIPALQNSCKRNSFAEIIIRRIRVFSVLKQIPIHIPNEKQFFLDGFPFPNSFASAVIDGLKNAGTSPTLIYSPPRKISRVKICFRLFFYSLLTVPVLFRIIKTKKSRLDLVDLQVLIGYAGYKFFLRNNPQITPIVISDVTPESHMIWAAALSLKRQVFWWQIDYYYYNGPLKESMVPFPCSHAGVLNQKGLEIVLSQAPTAKLYHLNPTIIQPLRGIPEKPSLGLATNGFFVGSPSQIELLKLIKKQFKLNTIRLRLHPRSELDESSFPNGLVTIAPRGERIENFAKSVDLAIVGNSAVQLNLLCEGLPVVHVSGFDPHGFDSYGYCLEGFTFGASDINSLEVKAVQHFYSDPLWAEKLFEYLNINDLSLCKPLTELEIN